MHYSSAKTNYRKPNLRIMTWKRLKPSNQKRPKLCVLLSCMILQANMHTFLLTYQYGLPCP